MVSRSLLMTLLITALAPVIWGSTYIVTTELLPPDRPLIASALRALPAGILLILFSRALPQGRWWWRITLLGFLNIGLFFYCLFVAAYYLPGGMAALVGACQPVIVLGLSRALLKTNFQKQHLLAVIAGIGGIALLVVNSEVTLNTRGIIMGLLGAASMATGVVLTKLWGRPPGFSLAGFTGWQLALGGIMILPVALWSEGIPGDLSAVNMLGYAYLAIIGGVFAYCIWFRGIEHLPTITLSFMGFLSSVSACVLGYVFLGQSLTLFQLLGAAAILAAIGFAAPKSPSRNLSAPLQENDMNASPTHGD